MNHAHSGICPDDLASVQNGGIRTKNMRQITLEELLEAGCHFGHQVTRSNPKAREFIFEARDNIHIIDLAITHEWLMEAANFVLELAKKPGSTMIVVGTKRQAQPVVLAEVKRGNEEIKREEEKGSLMHITNRWIGGLLTNFTEVSKNLKKLHDIEVLLKGDGKTIYTKKELGLFDKDRQKLESLYGGIKNIKRVPDALFIIDSRMEELAVREASRTGVSTVAIVDTNADPALVDYPIPANDDAVGSVELLTKFITDAWVEGKNNIKIEVPVEEKPKKVSLKSSEAQEKSEKEVKAKTPKAGKKEKPVKEKVTKKIKAKKGE